jgi:hypothetical protein
MNPAPVIVQFPEAQLRESVSNAIHESMVAASGVGGTGGLQSHLHISLYTPF